jgi:5-methylcytosine-specific restriction endonuclease McrA
MKRISEKRQAADRQYREVRLTYLLSNGFCRARIAPVCMRRKHIPATEVHHIKARSQGGALLDESNFLPVCRPCHQWIHDHPDSARASGFMVRRGEDLPID